MASRDRRGGLVKNGATRGQPQALCRTCGSSVMLRYGTAYADLHGDPAVFETTVRALAEGNSLRATARIVQIDKDTACAWLDRAAQQAQLAHALDDVPVDGVVLVVLARKGDNFLLREIIGHFLDRPIFLG